MPEITCHYIDTCYPGDLQDHHNRQGELLIYASIDSDIDWIISDLFGSVQYGWSESLNNFNDGMILKAIKEEFENFRLPLYVHEKFEQDCEAEQDHCYVYAYLAWNTEESED